MSTAIDQLVATGTTPRKVDPTEIDAVLSSIDTTIHIIEEKKAALLPVEKLVRDKFDERIKVLKAEHIGVENSTRTGGLSRLSLEPLSWLHDDTNLPVFAIFSPHSAVLNLSVSARDYYYSPRWVEKVDWGTRTRTATPRPSRARTPEGRRRAALKQRETRVDTGAEVSNGVPTFVTAAYGDALKRLREDAKRHRASVTYSTTFTGMIPADTRERIIESATAFQNVVIIAEAGDWVRKERRVQQIVPVYRDPLVCGWDGDNLWLIDRFDVTPIEEYIVAEFSV